MTNEYLSSLARCFVLAGDPISIVPFGNGHINDTYAVTIDNHSVRYVLQRINHLIFKEPVGLTENIVKVTSHIRRKLELQGTSDIDRKVMTPIPTHEGQYLVIDEEGNYWRVMLLIENSCTYETFNRPEQAYHAAKGFGCFQKMLQDFPGSDLIETIPGFHDTPSRLCNFVSVLNQDNFDRVKTCSDEVKYLLEQQAWADLLLGLNVPIRVSHNDTKFNNVLLDKDSGEALCVIDLDTVMPGLALYDFGDMVRTGTSPCDEDETDLSKVFCRSDMFAGLVEGFLSETSGFLTLDEKTNLVNAGIVITYEQAIRFLGDYLNGDTYYKIQYPEHNLTRAKTQIKLIKSILEQKEILDKYIK